MGQYQRWLVLPAIALAITLALAPGLAAADQKDPRLPELFGRLQAASDVEAARSPEASIWRIWSHSDDPAVEILMSQGVAAMARRDLRAALGKFDQIVKITPGFSEGWNKRATVHYLLGNFVESLHDIDRTLVLEPRHFGALSGRGLVYLELEEEEPALRSFEAALRVFPLLPGARYNAKALRKRLGDRSI
jgi:tetratricopeptide (TPR) repeat protein